MIDVTAAPAKKLALDPALPLRVGLGRALSGVLGYAIECVGEVEGDPEAAVHGFRKSVRRARAVVKLARPFLDEAVFAGLAHELRAAVRATSPLRDADVLLRRARELSAEAGAPVSPEFIAALETRRAAGHAAGVAVAALGRGSEGFGGLPSRFAGSLPPDLTLARHLPRAVARSYRAARAARRRAARRGRHQDTHAWRKRVKELRYQLEMVSGWAAPAGPVHQALAALAEALGDTTDRVILADALERFGERGPLADALEQGIRERLVEHLAGTEALFAARPRAFAEKLGLVGAQLSD